MSKRKPRKHWRVSHGVDTTLMADSAYKYDYRVVPDDPKLNAIWRAETLDYTTRKHRDAAILRRQIFDLCRKDFWYWAKGFAYVHEPRIMDASASFTAGLDTAVAFLPWPHQIPVVDTLLRRMGKKSTRIVKSRAQGASWLIVLISLWCWLFHRGSKINWVSKDEDTVDRKGDMDSLGAKADWLIEKLPPWMVGLKKKHWNRNYGDHTFTRLDGETAIAGFACTGDVASGGRALMFVLDEHGKHPRGPDREALASTQFITNSRVFQGTPKGAEGAFHDIIHDDTIAEPVLHLSWRDNPTQNRGYYRIIKGMPVAEDEQKYGPLSSEYRDPAQWLTIKQRLEERGYDLTVDLGRSPWYDQQCLAEGADPVLIAQELDEQFGVESARYFAEALVGRLLNQVDTRFVRGDFHVDSETLVGFWSENPDGRFRLWVELDIRKHPPMGEYIVACDVSLGIGGSGGSNSSITVLNRRTGKKVLSYASPKVEPHEFADIAIGLCKWFCNYKGDPAFLIWENQGPGKTFCQRLERTGFQHYYRRKSSQDAPLHARHTDKPGYWMQKRDAILGPYKEALLEGYFDNPDRDAIEELRQYQVGSDGQPYHVASKDKTDPAGAGSAHGDRVIADALAWHASLVFGDQHKGRAHQKKPNVMNVTEGNVPLNSFAHRRAQYLKMLRKQKQKPNW